MKQIDTFPVVLTPRTCSRCGGDFQAYGREHVCPDCKAPAPKQKPCPPGTLPLEDLAGRDRQIYDLVGRCFANKEIAWRLKLSEGTVKEYIFHLQRKTGLTRYQMIREYARAEGRSEAACGLACPLDPANEPQF